MQTDMHYYCVYALASVAGIPRNDAYTVAYSSQYVDDSTQQDSTKHDDGGLLYGIATAHHNADTVLNSVVDSSEQRRVWVPFHFIPGGEGDTLEEKLLCVKDSKIAREMIEHHLEAAINAPQYGLQLLGIAAHAYMDTFSHYGFSGIGSEYNSVDGGSIECIDVKNDDMKQYVLDKHGKFIQRYGLRSIVSFLSEELSQHLGHGGVGTYPDRPFLHWRVEFEKPRPDNRTVSDRDNPVTYMNGCENLYEYFLDFAKRRYANPEPQRPFEELRESIDEILRFEGVKQDRTEKWISAMKEPTGALYVNGNNRLIEYNADDWENQKKAFHERRSSSDSVKLEVYGFHQAAAVHRYYMLKDLLPKHEIAVY